MPRNLGRRGVTNDFRRASVRWSGRPLLGPVPRGPRATNHGEPVEPIPETHEALTELERHGDLDLRADLQRLTDQARQAVPDLVGVSLALLVEELVLTYVSTDYDIATLDGVQYADDGPCVAAIRDDQVILSDTEALLDEVTWHLFAQTSAAAGIRSTMSMPIRHGGVVTG